MLNIFFRFTTDKNSSKLHASKDYKNDAAGKIRHEPNLLKKLLRKKYKRQVNLDFLLPQKAFELLQICEK